MKKIEKVLSRLSFRKKLIISLLFTLVAVLGLLSGTYAWTSLGQNALNMGENTASKNEVYLLKLERDDEGKETSKPVPGATFYLYKVAKDKDIQIGSVYTTDEQGKIPVKLSPGNYYFEEINPSPGYTFDTDEKGKPIKRYSFNVTAISNSKQPIIVAYNKRQQGNLEISKEIKNEDGSTLTDEQRQLIFDFQLTFSDNGSYSYQIDGGKKQLLKSGEYLKLKHGQKAVFNKIPIGVHYIVTEKSLPDYTVTVNNSSGNISETLSVAHFVNTFKPKRGNLEISKKVINGDGTHLTSEQKKHPFEFKISFSDKKAKYDFSTTTGRTGTLKNGDIFTLIHDETLTLYKLPIGLDYEVEEIKIDDYSSSPSKYLGTVRGTESVQLPFVNQHQTLDEETGGLLFDKQVIANQVNPTQEFAFILTFSDGGTYEYQLNEGEKILYTSGEKLTIKHGDKVYFPELPAGLNYHLIEETVKGYQPQLEEVNGTILSNQVNHFTFHNYQDEKGSLIVSKIGVGEGFDQEKIFTFKVWINGQLIPEVIRLKAGETSSPIELAIGDTWLVVEENFFEDGYSQTKLINGTGVVTKPNQVVEVIQTNTHIEPPMIDLDGEKTWSIPEGTEVSLPEHITVKLKNDETVVATQEVAGPEWTYQFRVPKYDELGEKITYSIEEEIVENFKPVYSTENLDITNVYLSPVSSRELPIEKRITGDQPIEKEEFEFRLSPGQKVIKITGEGKGVFAPVLFPKAGTYVHTITERNKGTLGYTYDTSVYTWTVVVEEQNNQLVIVSEELKKNGEVYNQENLLFSNEFDATSIIQKKETIKGEKTWEYGTQVKEERPKKIIVLLRANEKVVYQKEIGEADKWSYSFVVNSYDESGNKIQYSIDEVPVVGYKTTNKGFDLTNTYIGIPDIQKEPEDNSKSSLLESILPQTNEKQTIMLLVMGVVIVLSVVLIIRKKKVDK